MRRIVLHSSDYKTDNFTIVRQGETVIIELTYPPESKGVVDPSQVSYVEVDQNSVRASGGIRIHFDYKRDGYVIEQPTIFTWEEGDDPSNHGYREAAFIPAYHPDAESA